MAGTAWAVTAMQAGLPWLVVGPQGQDCRGTKPVGYVMGSISIEEPRDVDEGGPEVRSPNNMARVGLIGVG